MVIIATSILIYNKADDTQLLIWIAVSQAFEFCMLTTSISVLMFFISRLNKFESDKHAFKHEKIFLFAILIIFDISFIGRLIYDKYHV